MVLRDHFHSAKEEKKREKNRVEIRKGKEDQAKRAKEKARLVDFLAQVGVWTHLEGKILNLKALMFLFLVVMHTSECGVYIYGRLRAWELRYMKNFSLNMTFQQVS